jgi:two-component system LytT family response regulator
MFSNALSSNYLDSTFVVEKQLEQLVRDNDKSTLLKMVDYLLSSINTHEINYFIDSILEMVHKKWNIEKEQDDTNHIENTPIISNKIILSNSDGKHLIDLKDIIRFQSDGNYTRVYIRNSKPILISKTLKEFEVQFLVFDFERVHQSHLINIHYIKSIRKGNLLAIELDDNTIVPVSRRRKERVIASLKLKKPLLLL